MRLIKQKTRFRSGKRVDFKLLIKINALGTDSHLLF